MSLDSPAIIHKWIAKKGNKNFEKIGIAEKITKQEGITGVVM